MDAPALTRRRTLALIVVALATLAIALTASRNTATAAQVPPGPAPAPVLEGSAPFDQDGFQCFSVLSTTAPGVAVALETDNFGEDRVRVRGARLSCETAFRYDTPERAQYAPEETQVFECFKLGNGFDPNRSVTLTNELTEISARVREAQLLCENALKVRPGREDSGLDEETAWQCFRLEDATSADAAATIVTDNWGKTTGKIGRAKLLCEEARKLRHGFDPYGSATGLAYVCSAFAGPPLGQSAILQTRNFGSDLVLVGSSALWCEQVEKTLGPATITVPAGRTVTLSGPELDGCNWLTYGYQIDGGPTQDVNSTVNACTTVAFSDTVLGPFAEDVTLRVYLRDNSCGVTFFSDGNHARVAGNLSRLEVAIRDGGGSCEIAHEPSIPSEQSGGNFRVDLKFD